MNISSQMVVLCSILWSSDIRRMIAGNVAKQYGKNERETPVEVIEETSFPDLAILPKGSLQKVETVAKKKCVGKEIFLVTLKDGKTYKCQNLKSDSSNLKPGSTLVIQNIVQDKKTKKKSAICICATSDDWAALVKYDDLEVYQTKGILVDMVRVFDIAWKEHKGIQRKIVLTEKGDVFRLRKSKLESYVRPGWMLKVYKSIN